jgi:hypothetical protein
VSNRGLWILGFGIALLGVGLLALNFHVFIDSYDQFGRQINCGTGYITDLTQAQSAVQADQQAGYVGECQSALAARRLWTLPLIAVGGLIISVLLVELWRHAAPSNKANHAHV